MKRLRVLVLVHEDLVPPESLSALAPEDAEVMQTEVDVVTELRRAGHELQVVGLSHELAPLRKAVEEFAPDIAFNLLEEFQALGEYHAHIVSYLELLNVPYTGCGPRGLMLARDKALAKKILRYHRIPTPAFGLFRRGRAVKRPSRLAFPLIVKSAVEDASVGIAQASVVNDDEHLMTRVEFIHERVETDALVEEYVRGRELTVGVLGNQRLTTLPVWELRFKDLPAGSEAIATAKVKFDLQHQEKIGLESGRARGLPKELEKRISRLARRVYRALELAGFARIDFRLSEQGQLYVLEANPGPDIRREEDFAQSAAAGGLHYGKLLAKVIRLGLSSDRPWKDAT